MKISACAFIAGTALLAATAPALSAAFVMGDNLGHTCYVNAEKLSTLPGAIEVCSRALEGVLTPSDRASALVNRGILKALVGDPAGAMSDYDSAVAADANLAEIYVNRSATMIALKRYSDAQSDASKAIQLGAHRIEIAYYNRALAEELLGNIQGAYDDYRAALNAQPQFGAASQQLSRFRRVENNGT